MDAHRVEVLDGAHDDGVVVDVAHDLHLELFPADHAFLDEDFRDRRQGESVADDVAQLLCVVGDPSAGAPHRERRADHHGIAQIRDQALGILDRVGVAASRHIEADTAHGLGEELAVLALLDDVCTGADELDSVALQDAGAVQRHGTVEPGLSPERREQRVGAFLRDHLLDEFGCDGLDVGARGQSGIGHDRRGIAVDQDHVEAVVAKHLACLGSRVVELTRLADDDRTGTYDQDLVYVCAAGHSRLLRVAELERWLFDHGCTTTGQGASRSNRTGTQPKTSRCRMLPSPRCPMITPVALTSFK